MALGFPHPLTDYQKIFLGSKARPAHKSDNFAAMCEPIAEEMWASRHSQPYRHPRPVTGIALLYFLLYRDSNSGLSVIQPVASRCIN
jgi:hypothetical protein